MSVMSVTSAASPATAEADLRASVMLARDQAAAGYRRALAVADEAGSSGNDPRAERFAAEARTRLAVVHVLDGVLGASARDGRPADS